MGIEDTYARSFDLNQRMPKKLTEDAQARRRILELKRDSYDSRRPNLSKFDSVFSHDEIARDQREVETSLRLFQLKAERDGFVERNEVSELFEAALVDTIESNKLFGENFSLFPASLFDDIKSGIDSYGIISRLNIKDHYVGIGFDVTFSSKEAIISSKLNSIASVIKSNDILPALKYCIDRNGNHISVKVPKVIIGTTQGHAEKLIRSWDRKQMGGQQELGLLQCKMIVEILIQAQYFTSLAKRYNNTEAYTEYGLLNNYFHDLFNEHIAEITHHWDEIQNDETFGIIKKLVEE